MIITNFQLFNLYEGLSQIMSLKVKIPIKIGYVLLKNKNILAPLYQAIRESLNLISGKETGDNEKNKELEELSNYENDLSIEKIPLSAISETSLPIDLLEKIFIAIDDEK